MNNDIQDMKEWIAIKVNKRELNKRGDINEEKTIKML